MILFGVKDAGPAEYIARIIRALNVPHAILASSISLPIFEKHGLRVNVDFNFKRRRPDLIITGTCLGGGIDKELVSFGANNSIPTISIIEHWTWMYERFELNGELLFPDYILVNDDIAQNCAIEVGIPKEKIIVIGNPVLEEVPILEKRNRDCGSWIRNAGEGRKVVFVSEELSNDFPRGSDLYLGFDEYSVLCDLLKILTIDDQLIIKLHPEESNYKFESQISLANCNVSRVGKCDVNSLLRSADYVIGMGSMLLLEAAKSRRDILSYRPGGTTLFIGNEMGVTYQVEDFDRLSAIMNGDAFYPNELLGDRFNGSLNRFISFIGSLVSR